MDKSSCELVQPPRTFGLNADDIKEIGLIATRIEGRLGYPVDIEWCLDALSRRVWILQCRPATGIFYEGKPAIEVSLAEQDQIPLRLLRNKKVELRLIAENTGVPISKAHLIFLNFRDSNPHPSLTNLAQSPQSRGFSAVVIYPEAVAGKIVRRFADSHSLQQALVDIATIVAPFYWSCVVILQEVFDPEYTGIAKRLGETLILDISRGHFVPKGVVPVSEYIVNLEGEILHSAEAVLDHYFRILNGSIIEERMSSPQDRLVVPPNILTLVSKHLWPFLANENSTIEFGVLIEDRDAPIVYLIDVITEAVVTLPDAQMITDGVMSRGLITGRLVRVNRPRPSASVNLHFHDTIHSEPDQHSPEILLSDLPDIALLDVLKGRDPKSLGFIFKAGSALCHLAIVLRERGIPALRTERFDDLPEGVVATLDADSPGRIGAARITFG